MALRFSLVSVAVATLVLVSGCALLPTSADVVPEPDTAPSPPQTSEESDAQSEPQHEQQDEPRSVQLTACPEGVRSRMQSTVSSQNGSLCRR